MKPIKLFALLLIGITIPNLSYSQDTTVQDTTAKVYFIRSTGYRYSGDAFSAFIDKQFVCELNNDKFSIYQLEPGEHSFDVQDTGRQPTESKSFITPFSLSIYGKKAKEKEKPLTINVEAGKTYYIQTISHFGTFHWLLFCQEMTENSAKTILIKCGEDTKCF
jgi:hypothetical protein